MVKEADRARSDGEDMDDERLPAQMQMSERDSKACPLAHI